MTLKDRIAYVCPRKVSCQSADTNKETETWQGRPPPSPSPSSFGAFLAPCLGLQTLSLPTPLSCFVFSRFCHIRHLVLTLLSAHKNKTLQGLCTCWISLRPQPSSLSSVPQSIHLILGIRILWLTNAETSGKEIVKSVACQIWGVLR